MSQSLPKKKKQRLPTSPQTVSNKHPQKEEEPLPAYLRKQASIFTKQSSAIENYFEQNSQLVEGDIQKCEQLLKNYIGAEKETQNKISELLSYTSDENISFESGLRFYTCKNLIFNQYLVCLKFYELFRLNGADFTTGSGLKLYQKLIYLKTLILKLAPVEKKLQYQKNKLLKKGEKIKIKQFNKRAEQKASMQVDQNSEQKALKSNGDESEQHQNIQQQQSDKEEDKLAYRPMVKNLISNKQQKKSQKQLQGKYVAPKQSSVLPAEEKAKRREDRQQERRKAHLLRKFRGDIESGDEAEERDMLEGIDPRFKRRYEEKMRFQEENFTRLNETRKEKFMKKQVMKNRFNNSLNNQLKEIQLIRDLVAEQTHAPKRPKPISLKKKQHDDEKQSSKPQKRRKMQ